MPVFPLSEWIEAIKGAYNQYGYLIVFLSTFCENTALLGLFLPGNSLVLLELSMHVWGHFTSLGSSSLHGLGLSWAIMLTTSLGVSP